ncbi:MAG: V-type ATP synthase subunit D [Sulfolobales archaeon]
MALDPRQTLPTKINLIMLRRALTIITKVRKILEDKREVLLLNIRVALEKYAELRRRVFDKLDKVYEEFFEVSSELGYIYINTLSKITPKTLTIIIGERSAFGIKVPVIELDERSIKEPNSSMFFTSPYIDHLIRDMKDLLMDLVKLSELEATINRLIMELKNTQKLINSLDYYVIPTYQSVIKRIRLVLEERSREEFIRLKMMKSKLISRGR